MIFDMLMLVSCKMGRLNSFVMDQLYLRLSGNWCLIQTEARRTKQKEMSVLADRRLMRRTIGALLHWAVVRRSVCGCHGHTLCSRVLGPAKARVQPLIQVSTQFVC